MLKIEYLGIVVQRYNIQIDKQIREKNNGAKKKIWVEKVDKYGREEF